MGQTSESFRLGALLAVAGGFLDAYTYLVRGGVFANAQTGNIVLLGVRMIQGQWALALHYLIPILAFAGGVVVADLVKYRFRHASGIHWRQMTVGLELVLLAGVAFLPSQMDNLANIAVSFVCAVQVESFRKVHGNALPPPCVPEIFAAGQNGCCSICALEIETMGGGRPSIMGLSSFS